MNVSFVVVVGASASALEDRRVCGGFLIRVTSIYYIEFIHMFEDDVT